MTQGSIGTAVEWAGSRKLDLRNPIQEKLQGWGQQKIFSNFAL